MFYLDAREDNVRLVSDYDFESISLREDSVGTIKVGIELPLEDRAAPIECL